VLTLIEFAELCRLNPGYSSGWGCGVCPTGSPTTYNSPLFHSQPSVDHPNGLDCCTRCATKWHGYRAGGGGGGGGGFGGF
jgi:hypothetical protein